MMPMALMLVAGVLALVDLVELAQTRLQSLSAWGVLALAVALLWGRL